MDTKYIVILIVVLVLILALPLMHNATKSREPVAQAPPAVGEFVRGVYVDDPALPFGADRYHENVTEAQVKQWELEAQQPPLLTRNKIEKFMEIPMGFNYNQVVRFWGVHGVLKEEGMDTTFDAHGNLIDVPCFTYVWKSTPKLTYDEEVLIEVEYPYLEVEFSNGAATHWEASGY